MKGLFTLKRILTAIAIVVLLVGIGTQIKTSLRLKKEEKEQKVLLQEANEYNQRLKEEKQQSDSGLNIEMLAREKLNMIKEGEKSVINSKKENLDEDSDKDITDDSSN